MTVLRNPRDARSPRASARPRSGRTRRRSPAKRRRRWRGAIGRCWTCPTPRPRPPRRRLETKWRPLRTGGLRWGPVFRRRPARRRRVRCSGRVCGGLKMYNNATTGTLLIPDEEIATTAPAAWRAEHPSPSTRKARPSPTCWPWYGELRMRIHFCHISTAEEITLLRDAKPTGCPSRGRHAASPLSDRRRRRPTGRAGPDEAGTQDHSRPGSAVGSHRDGTVDVVESDHAPHTRAEKLSATPPSGVPGLETTLPLLCTPCTRAADRGAIDRTGVARAATALRYAGDGGHRDAGRHGRQLDR